MRHWYAKSSLRLQSIALTVFVSAGLVIMGTLKALPARPQLRHNDNWEEF